MNCNHVPHPCKLLGGTLASLALLLFLNSPIGRSQDGPASNDPGKPVVITEASQLPRPVVPTTPVISPAPDGEITEKSNLPYLEAEQGAEGVRKLNLDECIALAMANQPALAAAQASYSAAYAAWQGLNGLPRFAGLLAHDLDVRKNQACLGIQAAQAGWYQAEWDTRYAVTRNYYSVVYARHQSVLVQRIVDKLDRAHKRAIDMVKVGAKNVTTIDVDTLYVAVEKAKARGLEASVGVRKALAALHEAVGLCCDQPLDIIDDRLPGLISEVEVHEIIAQALSMRGELTQAQILAQITNLEIEAQNRIRFRNTARTYAMGADIHATQIPQGVANTEYRPGAIPPEMPVNVFGPRWARMERVQFFSARAGAVVGKTENLICLEAKAAYWKWKEAAERVRIYTGDPAKRGTKEDNSLMIVSERIAARTFDRFQNDQISGEEYLRARVAADLIQVEFNEALYNHALGLAALQRVTAGGFQPTGPR